MTLNYFEIGRNIATARKAARMSQSELASKTETEQGHISRIENGMKSPNLELIVSIANTLETSLDALLGVNLTNGNRSTASPLEMLLSSFSMK